MNIVAIECDKHTAYPVIVKAYAGKYCYYVDYFYCNLLFSLQLQKEVQYTYICICKYIYKNIDNIHFNLNREV